MSVVNPATAARAHDPGGLERAGRADRSQTGAAGPLSSFADLIDVLNPLQHIPGVAEVYRSVTGDQISEGARYAGNALYGLAFGGPVGLSVMTAYSIAGHAVSEWQQNGAPETGPVAPAANPARPIGGIEQKDRVEPATTDQSVLGEETGRTTKRIPGTPVLLSDLVHGHVTLNVQRADQPGAETAPGKAPARDGLQAIASHRANHLPIDVLRTLQERHLANADNDPA